MKDYLSAYNEYRKKHNKLNHFSLAIRCLILSRICFVLFIAIEKILLGDIYFTCGELGSKGSLFNIIGYIPIYFLATFALSHCYAASIQRKAKRPSTIIVALMLIAEILLGFLFAGIIPTVCMPLIFSVVYLYRYKLI